MNDGNATRTPDDRRWLGAGRRFVRGHSMSARMAWAIVMLTLTCVVGFALGFAMLGATH